MLRRWSLRLRALFRREAVEAEFDDELRYHLDREIERNLARGMSPGEARRAARRDFGDPRRHKEEARETWRWRRVDVLVQDVRYAGRVLRRDAGFAVVAVLSLGFGIGATTTFFGVVDALDLRRLPYPDAERLVMLTELRPHDDRRCPGCTRGASLATAAAWRAETGSYDAFAFWSVTEVDVVDGDVARPTLVGYTTPGLFELLGVPPLRGRGFVPADTVPGAEPVALLTHASWRTLFGSDESVIGTRIEVFEGVAATRGRSLTVVGVLPEGFRFGGFGREASLWLPLGSEHSVSRRSGFAVARLKPGVTRAGAEAELRVIADRLASEVDPDESPRVAVRPLRELLVGGSGKGRWALFGVAGLVLLVAVLNVAGLYLARAISRQSELAMRSTLGASPFRLIRQLLVEGALLGAAAGGVGLLITLGGLRIARVWFRLGGTGMTPELDARVLAFAGGLSVLAGVLTALLPGLRVARADLRSALHGRPAGTIRHRAVGSLSALLTVQIAAGLVLLTGAGLLGSEFLELRYLDLGFDPRGVYQVYLFGGPDLRAAPEEWRPIAEDARLAAAALPGVSRAALRHASALNPTVVRPDAWRDGPPADESGAPHVRAVDPAWFETFRTPVLAGRALAPTDRRGTLPVAVVNEAAAARFWPGASPLGRQVFVGDSAGAGEWLTVVGVAADVERGEMVERHWPVLYRPFEQAPVYHRAAALYVRLSDRATGSTLSRLQSVVRDALGHPAPPFRSLERDLDDRLAAERFNALALNLFAAFALLLAAIGVYGSVAYAVSRRTREIGIRVALGARRGNVLALVARRAALVAASGVVVGVAGSLALTRVLRSLVTVTSPTSPWILGGAALLLVLVVLLATSLPARRATAVDPVIALRAE